MFLYRERRERNCGICKIVLNMNTRMCVFCRKKSENRNDFVRFTKKEGEVLEEPFAGQGGRGAYVCHSCFSAEVFEKKKPLLSKKL